MKTNPDHESQLQRDELEGQPLWFVLLMLACFIVAWLCYWAPRDACLWLKSRFTNKETK